MKNILMIAFHYPPMSGSSGAQRTLNFSRYLPDFGWQPFILTAHPRAHPNVNPNDIKQKNTGDMNVYRTFALDAARHLSINGRYPSFLAWPDRWTSWWFSAVPRGLSIIKKHKPDVIWSTYPIATAHLIGLTLSKISGLPWVADFRDPMTEDNYPDKLGKKIVKKLEDKIITSADSIVLTTPGALNAYRDLYPEVEKGKWIKIENGYDEESFRQVAALDHANQTKDAGPIRLIHSGLLYPVERDPVPFMTAVSELKKEGKISSGLLNIIFRASGHDELYKTIINNLDVGDIINLEEPKSYLEALSEMMHADGLLIFQAGICNNQIPAKAYEYIRAGRPILALADPAGDTAKLLSGIGVKTIAPIENKEKIKDLIINFIEMLQLNKYKEIPRDVVNNYSRKMQTKEFANLLNNLSEKQ